MIEFLLQIYYLFSLAGEALQYTLLVKYGGLVNVNVKKLDEDKICSKKSWCKAFLIGDPLSLAVIVEWNLIPNEKCGLGQSSFVVP